MTIVKKFLKKSNITNKEISEVSKLNPKKVDEDFISSQQQIIEIILDNCNTDGIVDFVKEWRKNFIDVFIFYY